MTSKATQEMKQIRRKTRNQLIKGLKAEQRRILLIDTGKRIAEMEKLALSMDKPADAFLDFALDGKKDVEVVREQYRSVPALTWLNARLRATTYGDRKNRPGNSDLHAAAIVEEYSRAFARAVDKILTPITEVPAQ